MPNPVKWITNVGKSISYSFIDEMKELNPALNAFKEDNGDFVKSVKSTLSIKNLKDSGKSLNDNQYFKIARDTIDNLKDDLRTGKLYNREREKSAMDKAVADFIGFDDSDFGFGDFDDDGGDFGFDEDISDSIDESTKSTNEMVDLVGEKTSKAISSAVIGSSEYMAKVNRKNTKVLFDQNNILFSRLHSDMGTVNANISSILKFAQEGTTTHYNNSATFYNNMTAKMEETNSLLKELVDLQKEYYGKNENSSAPRAKNRASDIIGSEGMPNLEAWKDQIKKNLKDNSYLDMLNMGMEMGLGAQISSTPGKFITDAIAKAFTPKSIKEAMKGFNETLSGAFSNILMDLSNNAGDTSIKGILGSIFGIDNSLKTEFSTGNYKKDAIPFDGVTKKAITEVIPTYLSKILTAISNSNETTYDYDRGKFVSKKDLKRDYDDISRYNAQSAFSDISSAMRDKAGRYQFDKDDKGDFITKAQFEKNLEEFLLAQYKAGRVFNDRRDTIDASTYSMSGGKKADMSAKFIQKLWRSMPNKMKSKLAGEVMSRRESQTNDMMRREYEGIDPLIALFNDSDKAFGQLKLKEQKGENPVDKINKYNSSILDVLIDIRKEVSYIREFGLSGKGKKSKKSVKKKFEDYNPYQMPKIKEDETYYQSVYESDVITREDQESIDDYLERVASEDRQDEARKARANKKGPVEKFLGFFSKSGATVGKTVDNVLATPINFLTGVINKADQAVYSLVFGPEDDNNPRHMGILERVGNGIKNTFEKVDTWLNENIFEPLKEKFTKENIKNATKKFFGIFGIDIESVGNKVKKFLFGEKDENGNRKENGMFGGFIDRFKKAGKDTANWIKGSAKDVYRGSGLQDTVEGQLNEQGKKKKEDRKKEKDIIKDNEQRIKNILAGRKEDDNGNNNNDVEGQAAVGIRRVPKTGVYALSKGEAVIPPDHNPANIRQRYANEARAIDKYKKHGNISMFAEGTDPDSKVELSDELRKKYEGSNLSDEDILRIEELKNDSAERRKKLRTTDAYNRDDYDDLSLKYRFFDQFSAFGRFMKDLFGDVMDKAGNVNTDKVKTNVLEIANNALGDVKEYLPEMSVGALIGAGASLITGMIGGPLLGAAVGSAVGLTIKSENVQKILFGDIETDENGNVTRKGGLLPKDISNMITKYAPNMAKGATLGAITSILPFVPGGPVAGIVLGSAVGFATKNEQIQNYLFGENGKLKGIKEKLKTVLPKMGVGAAVGAITSPLVPGGFITNMMLGSAIGFISDTDKFKDAFFGKPDKDGNRTGGIYGKMIDKVTEPVKLFLKDNIVYFSKWFQETIKRNLKDVFDPLKRRFIDLGKNIKDTYDKITAQFTNALKDSVFNKFANAIDKLLHPISTLYKALRKTTTTIIGLPFNIVGGIGRKMKRSDIRKGKAGYMKTAEERLNYRKDKKNKMTGILSRARDTAFDTDTAISQMNADEVDAALNAVRTLRGGSKAIDTQLKESRDKLLSDIFKTGITRGNKSDIEKLLKKNDFEGIRKYIEEDSSRISDDDKRAIYEILNNSESKIKNTIATKRDFENGTAKNKLEDLLRKGGIDIDNIRLRDLETYLKNESDSRKESEEKNKEEKEKKQEKYWKDDLLTNIKDATESLKEIKNFLDPNYGKEELYDLTPGKHTDKALRRNQYEDDEEAAEDRLDRAQRRDERGLNRRRNKINRKAKKRNKKHDKLDSRRQKEVDRINSEYEEFRNKLKEKRHQRSSDLDEDGNIDVDGQAAEGLYGVPYSGLYALSKGEFIIPRLAEGTEESNKNSIVINITSSSKKLLSKLGIGKEKDDQNKEKTTTSFYNGLPIKNKVDANGNVEPDTSDAETVNTLREREEDRANQKGIFNTIKGIPSKIGEIFGIGKKKEKKKENLLGKILKAAGIAMLAAFFAPKIINFIKKTVAPFIEDTVVPVFKEKILPAIEEKLNNVKNGFMKGFLGDSYTGDEPEGVVGAFGEKIGEGVAATKNYIEETVFPWITNTAIPAIGNMLGEILPQILANAIQNLPKVLGFLGKTGLKTMDILLGNDNNAGGTTTIDPNQLQSGETGMYDENGNILTAEDIQNGNYKKIYNSQGVEGTVEDGQIKFKDQSKVGGSTFKRIGNGMAHAFAHGKQGVMNKLLGKSSKVLKHLGIGGKAAAVATKVISKPIELAGKAGAKFAKGFDKFVSKGASSAVGETVEHVTGDVIENTTGRVLATAAETSGKGGKVAKILTGLISKLKDGVEKLFSNSKVVAKLSSLAETLGIKSVANWIKGFKSSVTEIFENALKKGTEKVGSSILKKAAGKINIILTAATLILDFLTGCDQAESILGVTNTTIVEEVVSGLINALCNLLIIPSIIPGVNWIAQKLFGVLGKDLSERQAEADKEYQEYINQTGSTETKEEYLKKKYSVTGKVGSFVSNIGKNVKETVSKAGTAIKNVIGKDPISGTVDVVKNLYGFVFKGDVKGLVTYKPNEDNSLLGFVGNYLTTMAKSMFIAPTAVSWVLHNTIGKMGNLLGFAKDTAGATFDTIANCFKCAAKGDVKGLLTFKPTDGDTVLGKVGNFVANTAKGLALPSTAISWVLHKVADNIEPILGFVGDTAVATFDTLTTFGTSVLKGDMKTLLSYQPTSGDTILGRVGNVAANLYKVTCVVPTAVSWVLHKAVSGIVEVAGFAKDTAVATFDTFKTYGTSVINGDLKGLLAYQPTDGDTILGKVGNFVANAGKTMYIVPTAISAVVHSVLNHIDDIVGFGKDTIIAGGETVDTYIDSVKSGDLQGLLSYQPTDGDTILGKVGNFTANLGKVMFVVPTAISAVVHKAVDKIEAAINKIKSIKTEDTEKAVEQAKEGKISVFSSQYWKTGETDDGIFGRLQTVFGTMYKAINLPFILIKSTIGKIVDKITNIKDWITDKFKGIKSFFKDPVGFIKDKVMGDEEEAEGSETRTSSSNEEHGGTKGSFARGGTVSRSGLYALSKGELVIPRLAEGTTDNSLSSNIQNAYISGMSGDKATQYINNIASGDNQFKTNNTNEQTKDSTMDANIKANAEAMGMTPEEYVKAYKSSYAAGRDIYRDGLYALSKGEYVASNIKNSVFNTANTVKNKLVSGINIFNPFNIIQDKLADMFISSITNKLQFAGKGNSSLIENHLQDIYSYAISGNDKFFKSESDNDSGTLKLIGMMGRAMFNPIYSVQKMQKFFISKVSNQLGDGDKVLETFNNQLEETNNYLSGKGSMKNYWNDKFDDDKSMLGTIGKTITTIYKTLQYPMVLAKSLFQTTSGMSSNDTESVDAVSGDNTSATTDATSNSDMNAASDSSASTTVSSTSTDADKAQNAINKATKKVKDKSKKLTYKNPLNKYAFVSDVKSKSNKKNMPNKYYRLVGLYGENRVRAQKNNSGKYVYLVKLTDGKWYDYDKLGTKKSGRGSGLYVGSGSYDPEPISEKSITGNNHPKMPFYTFKSPKTIEDFDDKPVVADQSKITPVSKNFVSQITGNISTERFNVSADTSRQTVSDSGCAPAVATMVINSLAGQSTIDMSTAVQDALGYKVPNSGVTSEYFDDEFNKYGISTHYIENDSSDPKDSAIVKAIKEKRPTILLGRDPNNKSKNNSPFGSNPHYVVADSISKDNQYIYINDPESRKPKTKYNLKTVLPRVTIGITTSIGRKARNAASKLNTYVGRATRQMVKPKNGDYISKYIHHFESGSDGPTAIDHCGNDGGLSFGSYQMIWDGPAPEFWSKYFASKYGSPTSCEDLKTKWLKAVNDIGKDAFFAKEWDYILNSDYLGLVNNIKSKYGFDPDQYSRAMQDCCWSWAVHRGVGGATKEFGEVASQFNNKPMDADETKLLNACYDVRASHMTGQWHESIGVGRYGTGADTERTILLGIVGQDPIDHTAPDGTAGAVVGSDDTSSDSGSSSNNSSKKTILDVLLAPFDLLASDYGLTGSDDSSSSGGTTEYNANGISGTVSSDKNIADKQVKVVAQMNSVYGKLKYAQDNAKYPGSRNPDDGSGDCSSTVEWAYKKALGVEVGGWSGEQATYDTTYTVDGGSTSGVTTDESKLQLGDILLYGSEGDSHAEMYFGHGQVLTHGNPDKLGPTTAAINRRADYWGARRLKDFKSSGTSTFDGNNSSSSNSTSSSSGTSSSSSSSSTSSSNNSKSKTKSTKTKTTTTKNTSSKKNKKKNKGSGSGLFAGMGSFVSQLDPKYANRAFNIKGDTIKQTIGDSGCAPAAATMVLNDIAGRASMMDSSKLALKYKGSNDGVTADYFSDIYSRNGLDTNYYNNSDQVRSDLRRGKDVVLLGSDKSNTSKSNSPFGPNSHYVVASGMSKDGRSITIKDPEAKKPKKYNADKILGHTKLGIGYGSGLASKFTRKLKKYIGRGFGSYSGILYVGDSRTEMMADCIHEDGVSFIAKVSQGLAWLKSTAGPEMEAKIKSDPNLAVVINMGVNDIYQPDNYIAYYTELKKRNPNAHLFYMSVNPVDNDPNCSDAEVQSFNSKMQSFWGSNYLDVYSYLKSDGYKTTDGTHYDDATSKKIHEKVKSMLSGTSSSTSGSSSSSSDSSNSSVLDRLLGSMDNLAEKYGLVVNVGGSDSSSSNSTSSSGSTAGSDYPKYNLTEDQVTEIATGVTGETGGDNLFESMQEASQMANLNEVTKKRQATGADMLSTLHSGWYASASFTRGVTDTAKDAVRKVFNEGKRTLPRYVTEHDTFPMDITNAKDRSAYQKGDPVSNRYGSNYKFYDFFGQNKEGDISGYFDQDYATYQNDVPWSGTGSGLLNNYPKYKGRGGFNDVMTAFSNYTDQMASSMGLSDSNDSTDSVSDSTKSITKKSDSTSDMTKLMKSVIKLLAKVADNTSDISEIVSILSKLVDLQSTQMNNSETKQKWTSLKTDLANKLSSYNKTSTGSGELSNLMNSIESLAME